MFHEGIRLLEKERDMLMQAKMMWGDKEGSIKRAIDNILAEMKKLSRRFHFLMD